MARTTAIRTGVGLVCAAGALVALTACGSGSSVDTSEIPLVRPAALTAKDGTQMPLPPQVADTGTASQRERYAAQVLVPTKLSVHVPAAQQACGMLTGRMPMKEVLARVGTQERLEREDAQRVVYAGTLSWCPAFRGTFDALALPGAKDPSTGSSSKSSTSGSTSSTTKSRSSSGSSGSSTSASSGSTDSSTGE